MNLLSLRRISNGALPQTPLRGLNPLRTRNNTLLGGRYQAFFILTVVVLLLLSGLTAVSVLADEIHCENLLLITPVKDGARGLDVEDLEQFIEDEFLLTYELRQEKNARALNSSHPVTVIGTNARYQSLMGYEILDGGFFQQSAWDEKSRYAVLNETAAFQLFGSSRITGMTLRIGPETWLITGVVRDGDEETANLYMPSSITGEQPKAIMVLMGGSVTEAYAKNALKDLGIRDTSHHFSNLSVLSSLPSQFLAVAWSWAALLLAVLLAITSARSSTRQFKNIKNGLEDHYPSELAATHPGVFLKTAGRAALFVSGISAALALSLRILETCLGWRGLSLPENAVSGFGIALDRLRFLLPISIGLFIACLAAVFSFFVFYVLKAISIRNVQ